jgi:histidinol-phosphatase
MIDLERAMDVAKSAVEAAAEVALPHWEKGVTVEKKADRTPVTIADKESEVVIMETIKRTFPDHAFLTEESGAHSGDRDKRWIVDPIDGTRGFSRGGKFWGPLVAFELAGEVVAGAMAMPALGAVYWAARGHGCWRNGSRCRVSTIEDWSEATLSMGELRALFSEPHLGGVLELIRTAASARDYGDLAACALVLDGQAEAWIEAGVKPWDIAPTKILLEEAGGRFTNFAGDQSLDPGTAIGTNGRVHERVLSALSSRPAGDTPKRS